MHNVLYIGSKWQSGNPNVGISNAKSDIVGSLEITNLAKCEWFAFDEFGLKHKTTGDKTLIKLCENNKFDFIILDWLENDLKANPTYKTLYILSHTMHIPIISVFWDTIYPAAARRSQSLLPYVKFHIIVDSSFLRYYLPDLTSYFFLWTPKDPRLYYDAGEEARDIPISFMGRLKKPGLDRGQSLKYLKDHGINVFHAGGQVEDTAVSPEEYASYIRRSQISLNFPVGINSISQQTAKAMEITLSGSLLLEDLNLETMKLFIPTIDYVPFSGLQDLVWKIQYYLYNDEARIQIAQNGCKKATTHYNSTVFWKTVLERLFDKG